MDNTATVVIIEPLEPGEGYAFENAIVGGVIPKEFIKPIDDGVREAMQSEWVDILSSTSKLQLSMDLITMSTRLNWPLRLLLHGFQRRNAQS